MNRHVLRLLVVLAVIAVAGFTRLTEGQAEETTGVSVDQSNVQVAINVAVYCPDVTQSIDQLAVNIVVVDIDGDVSGVGVDQTNVQVAYNLALYSTGATQLITQVSGNGTEVTTSSDAAVTIDQFNGAAAGSISFMSDGSSQTIAQEAVNAALVTTGSDTVSSAVGVVISQSNMAFALNVCFAGYILGSDEIPDLWEDCAPEWWWGDPGEAPEAWDAEWWEDDAPMTWEEWFEVWEEWWAEGAPGWDACLTGSGAPSEPDATSSSGPDSSSIPDSSGGTSSAGNTGLTGNTGSTTGGMTGSIVTGTGNNNAGGTGATNVPGQITECIDEIIAGNLPPLTGGFGTFAFGGCTFEELLATSGCDESSAVFFHNLPDGGFIVWIPGADVGIVNEAILAHFSDNEIPVGTIFSANCDGASSSS